MVIFDMSSSLLSVNWFWHHHRRAAPAANFNFQRRPRLRKFRRHITHPDADAERRALRSADHCSDDPRLAVVAPNRILRPRWRAALRHFERHTLFAYAVGLLRRQH